MVEIIEDPRNVILPLALKRLLGRPRKNRRKEPGESQGGQFASRRSTTVRCVTCKQLGHNKRTCLRDSASNLRGGSGGSKSTQVITWGSKHVHFLF
jgi:hypothetical protein